MASGFRRRLAIIGASLAACLAGAAASAEGTGTLTVRFTGLVETGGVLIMTLADSRELYESEKQALRIARIPVDGVEAVAVFEGLAAGEYAVKAFHDANENRELDIGLMGPKEKYGFSNNVMGFLGPPDYDDAKFAFDGSELVIDIRAR